jgi:threonine 3-dehydrogenase
MIPKTMRAVVKAKAGPGLEMRAVPVPRPGPTEVLIKVRANSICGTDLHILHWDPWAAERIHPPLIVGHELCGTLAALGEEVTQLQVGDFVAAESHVICGWCYYCRTGRGHICRNTQIIGVDRDGAFAEYVALPAINAWPVPKDMPPEIASLQENFGNAVHTAFATDLAARKVLVTGCGPVGIMAIPVARAAGARSIYATDVSDYRLELARTMGATLALNPLRDDVVGRILAETDGEGVDVLLEMSGAPQAIEQGFRALKFGGEAAMLGLPREPLRFDLANAIIFKGARVLGVSGRKLWETWYQATGLQRSGSVNLMPVVTHRFPIDRFAEAFAQMDSGQSGKVVMLWGE